MAHSFYFGGTADDPLGSDMVYMGGQDYGITLAVDKWDALTSIRSVVQEVASGYGNASYGGKRPPKLFTLPCILSGSSWSDTRAKMDALNLLLGLNRLAALRLDDFDDRYWMVRLTQQPAVTVRQMGAMFDLEFIAPDPRAYALTETRQTESLTTGTNNITVPASGVVAGTAETDVEFTIKPTGSGGGSPVVLRNDTRDETLTWQNTLTSSEWLRFTRNARQEKAEKSGDSGATWTAVNTSLLSGSRFPRLDAGVANNLEVSGIDSTGSLVVSYRARYA